MTQNSPAISQRLEDHLCLDLYITGRAVANAYRPLLTPLKLTYPQYLVMLALWQHGSQSVSALGARLSLDSGTLSPLLKRLETTGYLSRTRRKDDERAVMISLTEAGAALQRQAAELPAQISCQIGLNAARKRELQAALQDINARLKTHE